MHSTLGWPDVVIALIAGTPGIIAAVAALLVRREVKTPSGDTLGEVAERTHDITHATNMIVTRTIGQRKRDANPPGHELKPHKRADDD